MKKIDVFCASQASTAICMSMEQPSSSSTIQLGGRALDRYNPIIRDQKRIPRALPLAPCTSQPPPISPVPYQLLHKSKKSSSKNKVSDQSGNKKSSSTKSKPKPKPSDQRSKKIQFKPTDIDDDKKKSTATYLNAPKDIVGRSWARPGDFITPPGSTRYLLGDTAFFDDLTDYDPVLSQLIPVESSRNTQASSKDESAASKPSSSSNTNQVVVLRVSLHCKGCEGKVRKHLSRMEGVASFTIDYAAKKVTIVGDVTPSGVLASVSKIKSAQFWTSATPAAASDNTEASKK
uniref:HMA domain-containing protein n=1 Tax=Salix viminalis TaxID=40686 RepID=A0A6N2MQ15_SALVM